MHTLSVSEKQRHELIKPSVYILWTIYVSYYEVIANQKSAKLQSC